MRTAFFEALGDIFKDQNDIFVLTADLGFRLFDKIKAHCSERFYDVGVAEASLIGIASGLSLCGKVVYCYSIIPFLIMRAFEHIRIDIAYQNLNVKLIGVGGGFSYGFEGITHFGLEDLALMRVLPNFSIVVPADPLEAKCLAKVSYQNKGPMYIRLGKSRNPVIYDRMPDFKIGKAIIINMGKNIALFAIGNMVYVGKQVSHLLSKKGINLTLINMHTLRPLDNDIIKEIAMSHEAIFSLEEHHMNGGLGSAISDSLFELRYRGLFKKIGIPEKLEKAVGSADYLRNIYGLSPEKVAQKILSEI
jgi:transketolase